MTGSRTSLYVHVPFCVVKCGYCDFTSYEVGDRGVLDVYLDGLARELELTTLPSQPSTVFIGGGTPSFLDEPRLARLFDLLSRHVALDRCDEVTMEANPESLTEAKASLALAAGVTRLSIGAQSFTPRYLQFLDRAHTAEETAAAVTAGRRAGFDNISLDLMFGLPGQSLNEWQTDLEHGLSLQPDHLSCYSLTFEPGTALTRARERGEVAAIAPEVDREMFLHTRDRLPAAGFTAYEVSNFAGRGGACKHNDHYWLQGDYAGVGPGAASHRRGVRSTNLKPLQAWADSLAAKIPPVAEAETLGRDQRFREALWLGIRRCGGVDLPAVEQRLRTQLPPSLRQVIDSYIADGWLALGDALTLTDAGLLVADSVAEQLLLTSP